jgi:hypothetical protein
MKNRFQYMKAIFSIGGTAVERLVNKKDRRVPVFVQAFGRGGGLAWTQRFLPRS